MLTANRTSPICDSDILVNLLNNEHLALSRIVILVHPFTGIKIFKFVEFQERCVFTLKMNVFFPQQL